MQIIIEQQQTATRGGPLLLNQNQFNSYRTENKNHKDLRPSKWVRKTLSGESKPEGEAHIRDSSPWNGWRDRQAIDNNMSVFKLEM